MRTDIKISPEDIAVKRINNYPGRPSIIFLHDSLGCIELWRDFPERLGELVKCNVIIYDRQGYGQSRAFSYSKRDKYYLELEADILKELMYYWKVEEAILFGHSDGGSIALITAGKYPDNILGIISEGAHIFWEEKAAAGINDAVRLFQTTDLKTKLKKYHGDKTEDMFRAWTETWTSNEFNDWNIDKFLPLIKCPALIIQGENDEYGTLEQVERIIKKTKGQSEKLIIPGTKHSPHKEIPGVILETSARFINRLPFSSYGLK